MTDHMEIRPKAGRVLVRAGGAIVGDTTEALVLVERGMPEVIYIPRKDFATALLDRTDTRTTCPYKGEAAHYSIVTKSTVIEDAVWSYEDPLPEVAAIKDYLAFYGDKVIVEAI